MYRRTYLATAGVVLSVFFAGCTIDDEVNEGVDEVNERVIDNEGVIECEEQYIRNEIVGEGRTVNTKGGPNFNNAESRNDGTFIELETAIGHTGEQGDTADGVVTAQYLVTEDTVYRTEGRTPDGDPRDGTTVDC